MRCLWTEIKRVDYGLCPFQKLMRLIVSVIFIFLFLGPHLLDFFQIVIFSLFYAARLQYFIIKIVSRSYNVEKHQFPLEFQNISSVICIDNHERNLVPDLNESTLNRYHITFAPILKQKSIFIIHHSAL